MGRTNRPNLYAKGKVLDILLPCSRVEGLSSHVANGAENTQKEIWGSVVHGLIWSFSYKSPYSWGCEQAWISELPQPGDTVPVTQAGSGREANGFKNHCLHKADTNYLSSQ